MSELSLPNPLRSLLCSIARMILSVVDSKCINWRDFFETLGWNNPE